MALRQIVRLSGTAVYLSGNDIDTDRIIPARFLTSVAFDGLGAHLFHDERTTEVGARLQHPLDDPRFKHASMLLVGSNFGCGSSREHAPQAIVRSGFRAIIGVSFADIFFANAITIGLPCASVASNDLLTLTRVVESKPTTHVTLDLESQSVSAGELNVPCTIKPAARAALMSGEWDPIETLLAAAGDVRRVAERLPHWVRERSTSGSGVDGESSPRTITKRGSKL
jgi:3-isopropylmalate/(R)-2-methylmalate dehydratase small subunit